MMNCHFQKGRKKRVAFIFSCPGRYEEMAGRPAAGVTGKILELLLQKLSARVNRQDLTREDITITNSWSKLEYVARTGRTEANPKELSSPSNIRRIQRELNGITDFIVCCGKKAGFVVGKCSFQNRPKIAYTVHLGMRGINSIRANNTSERLDYICDDLIRQLGLNEVKDLKQS